MDHSEQLNIPANSPVINFYNGKSIFITGSTGLLGTVLVEKLLYTCEGIKNIYILIKQKHGQSIEERVAKFLNSQAFERLRECRPDFVKIIKPIGGNISEKNIGLSEKDITVLQNEVSVVFHSAANVSFDLSLMDAINTNTRATGELLELCKKMRKLTAFVYVSTAYSNCNRFVIDEKVYDMDVTLETVYEMVQHCKSNEITRLLLNGRPNTYTYSKALSELLVQKKSNILPCVIVRPSIILSSVRDPIPGWLSGWYGISNVIYAGMCGYTKCWLADPSLVIDAVPVDYTANLMIVSAWDANVTRAKGDKNVKVYNFCSGVQNPITSGNIVLKSLEQNKIIADGKPNTKANRFFIFSPNFYVYHTLLFFLSIIPAIVIDFTSWLLGKKMRFYKSVQKLNRMSRIFDYFCLNQFLFIDSNVRNLYSSLNDSDKITFNFDVTTFQWEHFLRNYVISLNKLANKT